MTDQPPVRLNEFSKEEWRDVANRAQPDWTEEQFEAAWIEFVEMKRRKELQ